MERLPFGSALFAGVALAGPPIVGLQIVFFAWGMTIAVIARRLLRQQGASGL